MKTRSARGEHWYYRRPTALSPGVLPATIKVSPELKIEIKRDGQYVVLPGSVHPGKPEENVPPGHVYAEIEPWPNTLTALPTLPLGLICDVNEAGSGERQASEPLPTAIGVNRNTTLTSQAGRLRRQGLDADEIEAALLAINRNRCHPPLSDAEVRTIARSISHYPAG